MMGGIEELVSKGSGRYKYVLFNMGSGFSLAMVRQFDDGRFSETHEDIVLGFLRGREIETTAFQLSINPINSGIRGGGILVWDQEKMAVTFYGGCQYGTPLKGEIDSLMAETYITYELVHPVDKEQRVPYAR